MYWVLSTVQFVTSFSSVVSHSESTREGTGTEKVKGTPPVVCETPTTFGSQFTVESLLLSFRRKGVPSVRYTREGVQTTLLASQYTSGTTSVSSFTGPCPTRQEEGGDSVTVYVLFP